MSSGTQIDLGWAGVEAGQGGAPSLPLNAPAGAGSGTAYLTDEEILGIEPVGTAPNRRDVIPSEARNLSSIDDASTAGAPRDSSDKNGPQNDTIQRTAAAAVMPAWMAAIAGDPTHGAEAQRLWQEHQAFRAAFSSAEEARTIRELLPGGAQEVQALRQIAQEVDSLRNVAREAESIRQNAESLREAAQSVDRIDAAIFSGDVRAQSEVVAELAQANPAAFRSLFAEAAKVLAGMGQGISPSVQTANRASAIPDAGTEAQRRGEVTNLSSIHNASRVQTQSVQAQRDSSVAPASRTQSPNNSTRETAASTASNFDPAAYASFERATNETVGRDVRGSISDTLTRVLPEGIAEGAARRIGEDIFNEVHRALAADRTLSEQVGEILRDRRFGTAEQQRVASLLASRAKQLVPSVSRRVIGEWTSSVLGTARTKAARHAAAASRVDIAAPGGSRDSMPLRQMSPREVNYASMSDDDILGM